MIGWLRTGRDAIHRAGAWHLLRNRVSPQPVKALRVESQQVPRIASEYMSRNFYILAASLLLFALVSAGMSLVPSSFQPGLPANASLWRTVAMFLLLFGLLAAFIGVMSHRSEEHTSEL